MLNTVGISIDTSYDVVIGFSILWRAVDADIKNPTSTEGWKRRLDGGSFGDNLCRALGLRVWIFLWDGVEGFFGTLADLQHVDSRRELVSNRVGKRIDVPNLVGELAP